jgi:universal stress protein E
MKQLERILVVCDPARRRSAALRRAADLARRSGARLHVYLFDFEPGIELAESRASGQAGDRARAQFLQERGKWLASLTARYAEKGLRLAREVVWAPRLEEAIVAAVREVKPDLVIKDVCTQSAVRRLLLLPRDWKLVRFCPCPLMLVAADSRGGTSRIIAGVDAFEEMEGASALNARVLEAATTMATQWGAAVHVTSVAPMLATASSVYRHLAPAIDETRAEHARAFAAFCERWRVPDARRHLLNGDPAHTLAAFALQSRAHLIVVGTHARSGLSRLLLGSTAEGLLNEAACDVLLVKPEGVLDEIEQTGIETRAPSAH